METAKSIAILLILNLLTTTIAQPMEQATETEPSKTLKPQISQTRTASCLLSITADPSVVPLNIQAVHYLIDSSAVAGKAAREVLGITSFNGPRPFEISIEQLTGHAEAYPGRAYDSWPTTSGPPAPISPVQTTVPASTPTSSVPPYSPERLDSGHSHSEPEQTTAPTPPELPTTTRSSRSTSSTRTSSNRQTSYGDTSTAKTPATPTPTRPMTMRTRPRVEGILGNETLINGRWYKAGDNIDDTKVLEIEPTHVTVEWQGRQETLFPVTARTTSSYGSSSRSRSASGDPTTGGYYEQYYGQGDPFSASTSYDTGSSSRYYSYSRPPTPSTERPTSRSAAAQTTSRAQTIFSRLQVDITDESAKPVAQEFLNALIANLREVLESACSQYTAELQSEIEFAETELNLAQAQLSEIMAQARPGVSIQAVESDPADIAVKDQLKEIVDLSMLTPEMSFSEALDEIKNSVDPHLEIVVLWRDLYDNAETEPTTETNMGALSRVPLHKALSLLLKAVSNSFSEKLTYSISSGVITIATETSVPRDMVTVVYEIPGLLFSGSNAMELADVIIQTIEPSTWFETEGLGEGTITPYSANKLVVRQTVDVHNKIKGFLDAVQSDAPPSVPLEIPPETFLLERQELQRQQRMLEMDVARLRARTAAIEQGVAKISAEVAEKLDNDSVTKELEKILEINAKLLEVAKKRYDSGTASAAEIQQMEEKLARARIELARRREELSRTAGGDELAKFNSELTAIAIDLAEKTAELQVLNTQLGRTETQLAMATTLDPQLSELRYAKETFEAARQQVNQLKTRLANLTPPTVTIIGAD